MVRCFAFMIRVHCIYVQQRLREMGTDENENEWLRVEVAPHYRCSAVPTTLCSMFQIVAVPMSRIRVPYTGSSCPRRQQQSLTEQQLGLLDSLHQVCSEWAAANTEKNNNTKQQHEEEEAMARVGEGSDVVRQRGSRAVDQELLASCGKGNSRLENFRRGLPCYGLRDRILSEISASQVVVISGETGPVPKSVSEPANYLESLLSPPNFSSRIPL